MGSAGSPSTPTWDHSVGPPSLCHILRASLDVRWLGADLRGFALSPQCLGHCREPPAIQPGPARGWLSLRATGTLPHRAALGMGWEGHWPPGGKFTVVFALLPQALVHPSPCGSRSGQEPSWAEGNPAAPLGEWEGDVEPLL